MSESDADNVFKVSKRTTQKRCGVVESHRMCTYSPTARTGAVSTVAGYAVDLYAVNISNNKVYSVMIVMSANAFNSVADALIGKYGTPP